MGILEIIVGTATSVLGTIVTRFVFGVSGSVPKSEIKQMVEDQLRAQELRLKAEAQMSLKSAVREVVKEIETLSKRLPYLDVRWNKIAPAKKNQVPVDDLEPRRTLLLMRIDQLHQAIAHRREELGLPSQETRQPGAQKEPLASGLTIDPEIRWVPVPPGAQSGSPAHRRFEELKDRISHRRSE